MATIHDVARRAQVSTSTVSLVLNNKGGIAEATVAKVKKVAAQLGYEAQNVRAKKTHSGTIVFVKALMHGHVLNQNHQAFIADYIDGLSAEASRRGYRTEVLSFERRTPAEIAKQLQQYNICGAIILATEMTPAQVEELAAAPLPLVFMDACYDALPFDFADMNNFGAVSQIVSHLANLGHRQIGLVQGKFSTPNFNAREQAFRLATETQGLNKYAEKHIYRADSVFEVACTELRELFDTKESPPSALFCVHDILALAAIRALRDCGRKVPEDVSVIGFDDLQLARVSEPPLSSYRVSQKTIGKKAAELLAERIVQPDKAIEKIRIDGCLIERSSVRHKI